MLYFCLSYGQDKTAPILKIYNTVSVEKYTWASYLFSRNNYVPTQKIYQEIAFLRPTIALMWQGKKRISHEIELSHFSWQRIDSVTQRKVPLTFSVSGNQQNLLFLALRYEYIYRIGSADWRFSPMISAAITPYIHYLETRPHTSLNYPETFLATGAKVSLIPRLTLRVSHKCSLDLNFPISLFDQSFHKYILKNPSLALNEQRIAYASFSGIADISARIGVGIRL